MDTCTYCGTEIHSAYCPFCDMELSPEQISTEGKRRQSNVREIPDEFLLFQPTRLLLKLETIELLYLLRYARKHRQDIYQLRLLRHKAERKLGRTRKVAEMEKASWEEYEIATRKVWAIENILKERMGYYPDMITGRFLDVYWERIERSQKKKMVIRPVADGMDKSRQSVNK